MMLELDKASDKVSNATQEERERLSIKLFKTNWKIQDSSLNLK